MEVARHQPFIPCVIPFDLSIGVCLIVENGDLHQKKLCDIFIFGGVNFSLLLLYYIQRDVIEIFMRQGLNIRQIKSRVTEHYSHNRIDHLALNQMAVQSLQII